MSNINPQDIVIYDRKLVDRVTLRLQTGISCYDIWLHSLALWNRPYNYEGSLLCTFIAYQLFSFPLFYCFLNAAIGLNLQLIFLHNINVTKRMELACWLGAVGLTLLITLPLLTIGVVGYGDFNKYYIATIIYMLYLVIIAVLVTIKLYRGMDLIHDQGENVDKQLSKKAIKKVVLLISRISLYPVVMIITHSGLVINQTVSDFTEIDSLELDIYAYLTGGILGLLNFYIFFLDPSIQNTLKVIYYRIVKKQEINQEIEDEINFEAEFEFVVLETSTSGNVDINVENQSAGTCSNLIKKL